MSETELMLWILDRVSSLTIYVDDIEGLYVTEVYTIGKTDFTFKTAVSYHDVLLQTYEWVKERYKE